MKKYLFQTPAMNTGSKQVFWYIDDKDHCSHLDAMGDDESAKSSDPYTKIHNQGLYFTASWGSPMLIHDNETPAICYCDLCSKFFPKLIIPG